MSKKSKTPTPQQPAPQSSPSEPVYYSIEKLTMQVYRLVELKMALDGSLVKTVLHRDIPPIVFGKLVNLIRTQGFVGDNKDGNSSK